MKLIACFFALLLISGIYAASAGSIITLDINADKVSPGQIVQLNGSVDDSLAGKPVGIEVQDPEGHVILIRTVTSDSYGNFTLKFKIPSSTALGKLDIIATIEIDGQAISGGKRGDLTFRLQKYYREKLAKLYPEKVIK